MNALREISVRELQHKLSDYLNLAKTVPLSVTKHGNKEVIIVNPDEYSIVKKSSNKKKVDLLKLDFIGMHKNKKDLEGQSSSNMASELREKAWYGN